LALLCDLFDIPERQMYCLRLSDEVGGHLPKLCRSAVLG
jgi:hypothetical protein